MKAVFVILSAVVAFSGAVHVKRDIVVAPAYYAAAPVYSSQYVAAPVVSSPYVAGSPLVTSQYVASAPVVSSAYVAAPNPVLARASRVLGEPGFVSRYIAAPVVAAPARYAVAAAPAVAAPATYAVETIAAPAKLVAPSPARYTLVA